MRSRQGGPEAALDAHPLAPRHRPGKPLVAPCALGRAQPARRPSRRPRAPWPPCAPASPLAPPAPCAAFCAAFAFGFETLGKQQGVRIPLRPLKKNARGCVRSQRAAQPRCVLGVTQGSNEAVRTEAVGCCDAQSLGFGRRFGGEVRRFLRRFGEGVCRATASFDGLAWAQPSVARVRSREVARARQH